MNLKYNYSFVKIVSFWYTYSNVNCTDLIYGLSLNFICINRGILGEKGRRKESE